MGDQGSISTYCSYQFESINDRSFFILGVVCSFVIPFAIVSICFAKIIKELRRTTEKYALRYGKSSNNSLYSTKAVKDQEIYSILSGVVYSVSWILYSIVCFLFFFNQHVPMAFEYFSMVMSKSSTISSLVLFCLIEKSFRKYVKRKPRENVLSKCLHQSNSNYSKERVSMKDYIELPH